MKFLKRISSRSRCGNIATACSLLFLSGTSQLCAYAQTPDNGTAATKPTGELSPVQLKPQIGKPAPVLSIEQVVSQALKAYPEMRVRIEQSKAAQARIPLVREQEYMPKGMSTWEEVAASHNKLTQILFGDPVLPPNPGPGLPYQTWRGNWFSGSGFLFDWSPIDFGLHRARVNVAKAQYGQAKSQLAVSELDIASAAASAFLNLVVSQEQVKAAEANVKRMTVVRDVTSGLVNAGLRPGVDVSLAEAELASIRNTLIQAEERREEAQAVLAASTGQAGAVVDIDPAPVIQKEGPPVLTVSVVDYRAHPLALAEKSVISTLLAQKTELARNGFPILRLLGGMNWRGSGLDIHGHFQKQDAFGLIPRAYNWNVGAMVNWDFLQWIQLHQQKKIQDYQIAAQRAQYAQIIQNLQEQDQKSQAMLRGAIRFAENMPVELTAAKQAELRARARYETGLGTIVEVADAERILARAEVDDAVAKVGVWKALLVMSNTRGSLKPFLTQIAAARTPQGM